MPGLCLVKDEKTLNKEAPIQILDKVPLPLVKGIPSPGTKGLHDKAWHSSYPYYADRANFDLQIDNPTLHTNSEGKMRKCYFSDQINFFTIIQIICQIEASLRFLL